MTEERFAGDRQSPSSAQHLNGDRSERSDVRIPPPPAARHAGPQTEWLSICSLRVLLQDTVVALQALALYSTLVFSPAGSSAVTVKSPSGTLNFEVNQSNKLLYQEETLQDVTGTYGVEVKGTTCASMQVSHRWRSDRFSFIYARHSGPCPRRLAAVV